jgi:YD repeat-containing protein
MNYRSLRDARVKPLVGGPCVALLCAWVGAASGQTQNTAYKYGYDNLGNIKSVTDPLGNTRTMSYDSLIRVTRVDMPPISGDTSFVIKFTYNGSGDLATVNDARRNLASSYVVNGIGNRQVARVFNTLGQMTKVTGAAQ